MTKRPSNIKGVLFGLGAFATFSTHDVIVKSLGGSYAAFQILFFSVLFAFPLTTLMMMRDRTEGHLRPKHPWWIALRTGAAMATGVGAFYAFSTLPMAQVYAIVFASPLLITLLAIPILGEKVGVRRGIAVAVGLAGVLVVLRPGDTALSIGHAAALLAAVGGALASVIVRKIGRQERSVVLLLYPMMANFLVMGALLPFVYKPLQMVDLGALAVMAALAFIASLLLIAAYRNGEAAVIAPMQYSQMIWAVVYGWILFGEAVDPATIAGSAIIIASGLYIVVRESTSDASDNRPVLRTRSRPETGTVLRVGPLLSDEDKPERPPED